MKRRSGRVRSAAAHPHPAWLAQQTLASRRYFGVVMVLGVLALAASALSPTWRSTDWTGVGGWAALAILTSFSTALQLRKIPDGAGTVTMRDVWSLSALFIWGLPGAVVVNLILVVWSESVTKTRLEGRTFVLTRCGFNAAFTSVALVGAWAVIELAGAGWLSWLVAGFTFEALTVIAVELHVIADQHRRRLTLSLVTLVAMCLTEVPLAVVLEVTWELSWWLAAVLAFPIFIAAAGLQYILEFIELRELMSTDSRTGLLTPAAWRESTEKLLRNQQIAVLMADLDNFKRLNDNFGHLVGDEILKLVGDILTSSIRPVDLACRWGGEEFVVVLAGTAVPDALLVAERIRSRVHGEAHRDAARVTISIGVAGCPATAAHQVPQALTAAIALADAALYQAKRDGRNRIAVIGTESSGASDQRAGS